MTPRARAAAWLREPLAHFLIAGALVFVVSALRDRPVDAAGRTIVVTAADAERLAAMWTATWQRPPAPAELDGLIRERIKEEVYYREALRLGLDKDDAIVRRRLRSKMESLATAATENAVPGDRELQAVLDRDPAKYSAGPAFSFDQVYVAVGGDDDAAAAKARAILARLSAGGDPATLGDAISLPGTMENAAASDIARRFGEDFAAALGGLPAGAWSGPVRSGFGLHLVRVRAVTAPKRPALADVRRAVENDWRSMTRETREAAAYQTLLDGYDIKIERPR